MSAEAFDVHQMKLSCRTSAIYLITGPMAAGKSTVAHLLAERFERGVPLPRHVFEPMEAHTT